MIVEDVQHNEIMMVNRGIIFNEKCKLLLEGKF